MPSGGVAGGAMTLKVYAAARNFPLIWPFLPHAPTNGGDRSIQWSKR